MPFARGQNISQVSFSSDELNAFREAAAGPAAAAWIEANNARCLPAQEPYDLVKSILAKI